MEFKDLNFIRIQDFRLIPRYLMEQVKGSDAEIDRILQYNFAKDPLTLLYALADDQNKIKGFLWADIDVLEGVVHVNALSVDKDYQDGKPALEAVRFLQNLIKDSKLKKKITFATTRPKAFERMGFKRTKLVNMEIE